MLINLDFVKCFILFSQVQTPSRNHFTNVAVPDLLAEIQSNVENQISDGDISHFTTCGHQQLEILTYGTAQL